jgi:hypothetical protein
MDAKLSREKDGMVVKVSQQIRREADPVWDKVTMHGELGGD